MKPLVLLVAGLGWGDEGKGSVVEKLAIVYKAELVVRYQGGPQAAHNVVLADGTHHTFSQFGSATLHGGMTHLSRFMLVDPLALRQEAAAIHGILGSEFVVSQRLTVDEDALVISQYHRAANRIREANRRMRHGSCGLGIGETRRESLEGHDVLRMKHLRDLRSLDTAIDILTATQARLLASLNGLRLAADPASKWLLHEDAKFVANRLLGACRFVPIVSSDYLKHTIPTCRTVIFEGAQGVLLDEKLGYLPPHVTWTDCTYGNARHLLEGIDCKVERWGVTRSYHTRHGAGPLPGEGELGLEFDEKHNKDGDWQGPFRTAPLNADMLRRAVEILGGIDMVALTCCDHLEVDLQPIVDATLAPIFMQSYGPTARDKCMTPFYGDRGLDL